MKKRKKLIGIILLLLIIISLFFLFLFIRTRKNALTLQQRQWIDNNKSYVVDVSVLNDIPAFTYNGTGLVFDFLNYLNKKTDLSFKPVVNSDAINVNNDYSFNIVDKIQKNDILMNIDNYVIISKDNTLYDDVSKITNKKIGVLENDIQRFSNKFNNTNQLVPFKTKAQMISSEEITDFILLKSYAMDYLIKNKAQISYQFSDKKYYVFQLNGDDVLNSILRKYYYEWEKNYYSLYNKSLLNDYYSISNATEQRQVELKNQTYLYGFVNNGIFDSLKSGKLVGINKIIIKSFSEFADISIKYKKYSNIESLNNDFNNNTVNIMVNNEISDSSKQNNNNYGSFKTSLFVISDNNNEIYINDINDLNNYKVCTIKNSKIEKLLKQKKIKAKRFDDFDTLIKKHNKDSVIIVEKDNFDHYKTRYFKNYHIHYVINSFEYGYKINVQNNTLFNDLFNFYINYVDVDKLVSDNYKEIAYTSINYSLLFVIILILIGMILLAIIIKKIQKIIKKFIENHRNTLSKEEKIKYIDQLTSLKNRSYLNTKVEQWDESETYPQAVIVVDLNNIAFINDNYGREEGDKIIRDAANILIQTQIPNTEIIRTDGNEFLIYAVGYQEKEIISYLRRISKSLKTLDHGFGAAMGYSMILDAIKTFDDAVNEATIEMKQIKEDSLKK